MNYLMPSRGTSPRFDWTSSFAGRTLPAAGLLLLLCGAWYLATGPGGVPSYLLPRPSAVAQRLIRDAEPFARHFLLSAVSATVGFVFGGLFGWLAAGLFLLNQIAERAFYPLLIALKSLPIVVIAPFIALWLGTDVSSRIMVVALTAFFPTLVNCIKGFRATEVPLLEVAKVFGAGPVAAFWKVRVPYSLPFFFAGMRVAAVLAVVAALIAEMMGASSGLGFVLTVAIYRTDTEALFCVSILSTLLTFALYGAVQAADRYLLPWTGAAESTVLKET